MWFLLFITCAVTGGIMNSINYGLNGFKSAFMNWTVYGLLPFLLFGIIHGLTTGYFLGREIKKRGRWLNALQQNVSAMVPWRVSLKFYLRSTFLFRGQDAASKGTTAETQTLCTMRADTQVVRNGWQSKFLDADPAQGDRWQVVVKYWRL